MARLPLNAFSVDLEEWYHAEVVRGRSLKRMAQVEEATAPLLDLLHASGTRATFFVLGEVMAAQPDLVRRIRDAGHEIACHSMTHRPLWEMSEAEFRRELHQFADMWKQVLGEGRPLGYRAPTFSLDRDTRWALEVLQDFGYLYDSSVFPMRTPMYGIQGAPLGAYRISLADPARGERNGGLWELPVTVGSALGVKVPAAGGVYLRMLPYRVIRGMLRRAQRERPLVLYVHPWELYPKTPKVGGLPLWQRAGTYGGARGGLAKVRALLRDFRFAPAAEVLGVHA